jgi:phosphatidylethanolamine/phosphatidyl-N-methylethanolamine N-methyltransferase
MARSTKQPRDGDQPGHSHTPTLHSPLSFVRAFVSAPFQTGAVWPSSKRLARVIVDCCQIKPDDLIVELGPGTGAFSRPILERLNGRGGLLAVEINPANAAVLRRSLPRCEVVQDSAENLAGHMNGRRAHSIVSGLAWGNMLPRVQDRIFQAALKSLAPGGQFIAFAYVHASWFPTSRRFRRLLLGHFDRVETTPIIWRNLPPAFVYHCRLTASL